MNIVKIDKTELESFLDYISDKVEECYEDEIKKAVERFKNKHLK